VKAQMERAARKLPPGLVGLVKFHDESGEIAPDAQASPLGRKVEEQAAPKLLEFSSKQAGSVKIGEMRLPDGTVVRNYEAIGPSSKQMTVSFVELATLIDKTRDVVAEVYGWCVGICVKVFAAGKVLIGSGAEESGDADQGQGESDESQYDDYDNVDAETGNRPSDSED
jgi:hypothetical protein